MSEYGWPLLGGILIGLGSLLAAAATGKIPGISGVVAKAFQFRSGDTLWRWVFLLGLVAGAGLAFQGVESASVFRPVASTIWYAVAGLLVGFGSRLGGGCTSGHGVCGMGLGARDSIVATCTFMAVAIATVYVLRHLVGVSLS
jgi:uncharacterized membrane protein YedE/YeeE